MPSSQQKPKKATGERNSNRPNGKAWKRRSPNNPPSSFPVIRDAEGEIIRKLGPAFDHQGRRLEGKGKPTGKSICGIARARVVGMAMSRGITTDEMTTILKQKRADKREARKYKRRDSRYAAKVAARETVNGR